MDYTQALEWLHSLGRLAKKPGLARMQSMMDALGNPQRRLRYVHVAGTNGKGSATVMLASIVKEAGYTVGANIGPYVLDFRERYQINGIYASGEAVAAAITRVRQAAETMETPPVEFVATTATAFVLFEAAGCDIVCMEAGIGGRSDDTNIIEDTLVACMMRIGYDHTELLGETIEEIAADKCGIFKNNCDVVVYPAQPAAAMAVIEAEAKRKGCPLHLPDVEDIRFSKSRPFENQINYGGYDLRVPFPGPHQALNASVAVEAALCLWRRGFHIEDVHIIKGIEAARLPARIEVLSRDPLVILDGAHNADSAEALAHTLQGEELDGLTVVMGVMADKQVDDMLRILSPYIYTLYTVTPDSPRAMLAPQLAARAQSMGKRAFAAESVEEAVEAALYNPGEGILICGSFYLAGAAKDAFYRLQDSSDSP